MRKSLSVGTHLRRLGRVTGRRGRWGVKRERAEGRVMRLVAMVLVVLVLGMASESSACPNCKEAVAAQPSEVARMKNGYNWSVLFMVAMPFTLFGTGAFMVARAVKRGTLPEM